MSAGQKHTALKSDGFKDSAKILFRTSIEKNKGQTQNILVADAVTDSIKIASFDCQDFSNDCEEKALAIYNEEATDAKVTTLTSKDVAVAVSNAGLRALKAHDLQSLEKIRQKIVEYAPDGLNPQETKEIVDLASKVAPKAKLQEGNDYRR